MFGEFTLEDKSGKIVYASSPGMEQSISAKQETKKPKVNTKRLLRRAEISIFVNLAEEETDDQWEERFEKMAIGRFPDKIKWNPTVDVSKDPPDVKPEDFYGELIYVNRQQVQKLRLSKDEKLQDMRLEIKSFIQNYTNIDMEQLDDDIVGDGIQTIPKTKIVPVPWSKLSAKDQAIAISEYVKTFAIENNMSKEETEFFIRYLTVYSMGKNIVPFIVFDKDGSIEKLRGIVKEYDGTKNIYKLKTL